jgi:GAF domain-containing protein
VSIPDPSERIDTPGLRPARRGADDRARLRFLLALVDRLGPLEDPLAIQVAASLMLAEHLGDANADYVEWHEVTGRDSELEAVRRLLVDGLPLVIEGGRIEAAAHPRFPERLAVPRLDAQVIAPVVRDGGLVAALSVGRPASHRWTPGEVSLIEEVAQRTALAVQRARREADRRDSQARYHALFEEMDQGFAMWEVVRGDDGRVRDTRCVEMNNAFERLTELGRAESIGRLGSELLGESEDWWLRTCERIVETGEAVRYEHHLAGTGRWHEVAAFPFGRDRLAGLYADITRRKRVEAALALAAERDAFRVGLGDAFRALRDPVAIQAAAARMMAWHLGAGPVHYGELESDGLHVRVSHDRPPEQPERYRLFGFPGLAVHMKAGRSLTVEDIEAAPQLRERERASFRARGIRALVAVPLVQEGRLVALFTLGREAAYHWPADEVALIEETAERTRAAVERARAERSIADDLRDTGLLRELGSRLAGEGDVRVLHDEVMAAALAVTSADGGALHIVDLASGDLALLASHGLSAGLLDRMTRLAVDSSLPATTARLQGRRVVADFAVDGAGGDPIARLHTEGGFRSTQATPLTTRSGEVIGVLSTCWRRSRRPSERELRFLDLLARQTADLIEGRRTTQALRDSVEVATAARREAEAANRAKDEFLAVLSHELRTPLTPIVLWGRMLLEGHVPLSEISRAVKAILDSAESQSRLIDDLLDLSRSTAGRLSLQPESTDVAALVGAAVDLIRPAAEGRRRARGRARHARSEAVAAGPVEPPVERGEVHPRVRPHHRPRPGRPRPPGRRGGRHRRGDGSRVPPGGVRAVPSGQHGGGSPPRRARHRAGAVPRAGPAPRRRDRRPQPGARTRLGLHGHPPTRRRGAGAAGQRRASQPRSTA